MTLSRVPEPEVMDSQEEALAYDDMDHTAVNSQFVADLLSAGDDGNLLSAGERGNLLSAGERGTDILDLGAGTGRIPLELCERCEDCRVLAVDLSVAMLDVARINIELANLSQRISLDRADAKELPYEDGQFHATISNSIVHHVPDPLPVLREAVRVTALGGRLFFRDLLRPDSETELEALVAQYTGSESAKAQTLFRESLWAAFTLAEMQSFVAQLGYEPSSVVQTSDRHWTWSTVKQAAEPN